MKINIDKTVEMFKLRNLLKKFAFLIQKAPFTKQVQFTDTEVNVVERIWNELMLK